jgi:hypothetical protein
LSSACVYQQEIIVRIYGFILLSVTLIVSTQSMAQEAPITLLFSREDDRAFVKIQSLVDHIQIRNIILNRGNGTCKLWAIKSSHLI